MNIFIDIETVPDCTGQALALFQAEAVSDRAAVTAPSNYKDPVKIAEYISGKQAEIDAGVHDKVLKTSFDGALGHICVIGVAIDDQEPEAFFMDSTEPHKHEADVLRSFYQHISAAYRPSSQTRPVFVGHNLLDFDLRFIFQRSVVLGIQPPTFIPFQAKPWDGTVYDTMTAWAGVRDRVKLDKLAKALGFEGKGDIDGSQVWPMVAAGRISDVAAYCKNDVIQTRNVYRKMTFQQAA